MKRKMLGAASVAMAAAAFAMPSQAAADEFEMQSNCGPTVQACVVGVVNAGFEAVRDGLQLTIDTIEAVCDTATNGGCTF